MVLGLAPVRIHRGPIGLHCQPRGNRWAFAAQIPRGAFGELADTASLGACLCPERARHHERVHPRRRELSARRLTGQASDLVGLTDILSREASELLQQEDVVMTVIGGELVNDGYSRPISALTGRGGFSRAEAWSSCTSKVCVAFSAQEWPM